ncbi:MAG: class I SAM-dependent methyltransferase [Enhydrobacter sp.]|nr:MAG: class I SAM-dependent methyltransferase [Enhydrobacter sp.]
MWLAAYERRIERQIAEFGRQLMVAAAPQAGESVLDVGCGTGQTTLALARAVGPTGSALGIDISRTLIGVARTQVLANLRYEVLDAATHAFAPAAIDLLFSRFGVMFFGDPVAAFANLRRALKSAGRVTFLCWRSAAENPWQRLPIQAAAPHLPPMPRPGPGEPGPFAFGDRDHVQGILAKAGFADVSFQPVDGTLVLGHDVADVTEGLRRFGPLARVLTEVPATDADKALAAVALALQPHVGPQGVALPGAAWIVQARPA